MKPNEINEAIAKSCGWSVSDHLEYCAYGTIEKTSPHFTDTRRPAFVKDGILCNTDGLPSYCTDLNAMWDAEATLPNGQWEKYESCLLMLCAEAHKDWVAGKRKSFTVTEVCVWHATAMQRAEAFLRTIGRWID